jgi:hypothetical protein
MLSSAPSFTVLTSSTVKDEVARPPSPKRTSTTIASTSTNNLPNKRSASSSSKSPAATTTTTKKKRLTMTNTIQAQAVSPTIRHTNTIETITGQNKRSSSSVDDIIFFEKVYFQYSYLTSFILFIPRYKKHFEVR